MKKAFITGIDGQDGSYLAEFLLDKGYKVHGMVRRVALEDPEHQLWRIKHILKKIALHPGSLESYPSIFKLVEKIKPDECYHLAAQSFVGYSFEDEFSTINTNINGTHFALVYYNGDDTFGYGIIGVYTTISPSLSPSTSPSLSPSLSLFILVA